MNTGDLFPSSNPVLVQSALVPRWTVTVNRTGITPVYLDSSSIHLSGVSIKDLNNTHLRIDVITSDTASEDVVYSQNSQKMVLVRQVKGIIWPDVNMLPDPLGLNSTTANNTIVTK